ncbi:MAG: hypothetical protein U0457_06535 [Candidatus Sericytochromatia bacterium]
MNNIILIATLLLFTACTTTPNYSSYPSSSYNDKTARGLTGGGLGGGIIVAENNITSNSTYNVYLKQGSKKVLIKSGQINSNKEIELSDNALSSEDVNKIQNGEASIILEIDTGDKILTAEGKIITKDKNGNKKENYLA